MEHERIHPPVERSPRSRRNAWIVLGLLVLVGLIVWAATRGGGDESGGRRRGGPGGSNSWAAATVGVAKAVRADVPQTVSAIGTVTPIVTATVRPQLSGNVFAIDFTEGQTVRAGQRLALIDPRPYRLQLAQAEANLARDQAQLNLANVTLQRYRTLLAQDSIARQEVDTQAATAKQLGGTVAADQAAIGTARLNLQYTAITAPVSGRVGLRQVDIGNYVTAGDANGVAVITQTTPIDVAFALPQADLQRLLARARGAGSMPVVATDQSGKTRLAEGRFLTFDNQIDATTGTVRAKARFPNPTNTMFPNQFVNVTLTSDTLRNVVTVPVSAVRHGAQGDFVFLVNPDKTAKLQTVKLGPTKGVNVAVLDGVAAGQLVVTEGADDLDNGSKLVLPGDKAPERERQKKGFFARLFGGGGREGGEEGGNNTQGAAPGGGGQHRGGGRR